jgi:hypothetical protein
LTVFKPPEVVNLTSLKEVKRKFKEEPRPSYYFCGMKQKDNFRASPKAKIQKCPKPSRIFERRPWVKKCEGPDTS